MEDRSRELDKKDRSPSSVKTRMKSTPSEPKASNSAQAKGSVRSVEDLLKSEEDLPIEDHHLLEQYTLQKITLDWLNWNARFFNYMEEPYGFYVAELLAQDFRRGEAKTWYSNNPAEWTLFMQLLKMLNPGTKPSDEKDGNNFGATDYSTLEAYAPFRWFANALEPEASLSDMHPWLTQSSSFESDGSSIFNSKVGSANQICNLWPRESGDLISYVAPFEMQKELSLDSKVRQASMQALTQRQLRKQYNQEPFVLGKLPTGLSSSMQALSYLDVDGGDVSYEQYRDFVRKQNERAVMEEESKKVFMLINSFGGSVGNGMCDLFNPMNGCNAVLAG
jgi:hypothetical protein